MGDVLGERLDDLWTLDCAWANATETEDEDFLNETEWLWLVGVGCSVVSSFATALGTILQKKAHNIQQALPDEEKAPEFMGIVFNRVWLLALVVMALIPLPFDFVAFALAPQSVVVPMTGLTIILSAVAAVVVLDENLTRNDVIGTMIILTGVALTTTTAGGNPEDYNACELIARYSDLDVVIPASALLAGTLLCVYWLQTGNYPGWLEKLKPEMYAFVAGSLGALMNVAFKATGELAKGAVGPVKSNTWLTIHPYYHILAITILAAGMLSALNLLLSRVDAIIATPLFFTNLILCSTTLGLLFYREYRDFRTWQWVLFPVGIAIVCSGVLFTSLRGVDLEALRRREAQLRQSADRRPSLVAAFNKTKSQPRLRSLPLSSEMSQPLDEDDEDDEEQAGGDVDVESLRGGKRRDLERRPPDL